MLHIDADKHNFGQLVKPMERASSLYFRKPRPVFWEHFFFGNQSPIKSEFLEVGENGSAKLSDFLFNLDIEIESDWLGYSREVRQFDGLATDEHFYSFGVLLGYAYLFGIRDLHKFNLIKTKTHLQVIDAEVVLTNLILPNESVLLPFKDVPFEVCGLSSLVDSMSALSADQKMLLFAGYFDLFASAYRNQQRLLKVLTATVGAAPIRVIIRNTRIYTNHINGSAPILDLLSEEKNQIDRGDVPYFFKRLGNEKLHWLSSTDGTESSVESLESFRADVARHAQDPANLIGTLEGIEKKMVQGALFLQRKFEDVQSYVFKWNGMKLELGPTHLLNAFTGSQYRTSKTPLKL